MSRCDPERERAVAKLARLVSFITENRESAAVADPTAVGRT